MVKLISVVKIQKWIRGYMYRRKRLPTILYSIQKYLQTNEIHFSDITGDGRVNSCIDEEVVIHLLEDEYLKRVRKPKIRMWYDVLLLDYMCGWIPVNIKTTTMKTNDNTGNLAMCVFAYTNERLELNCNKSYENGKMSEMLFQKLRDKQYNKTSKKDYYFIVLNKTGSKEIIVNSVLGLSKITPNSNNLPFQVNWLKNRDFQYAPIREKIKQFVGCLKHPVPSWKEQFMTNIRTIQL
jgi:hypothetical protein